MKKAHRIKKELEFQQIMAEKKSFANRNFIVYIAPRQKGHYRVGLSVGKKVGNAVTRNYIKRLMRESLLELGHEINDSYDMIIIARPNVTTLSLVEVRRNLEHVFKLANIL